MSATYPPLKLHGRTVDQQVKFRLERHSTLVARNAAQRYFDHANGSRSDFWEYVLEQLNLKLQGDQMKTDTSPETPAAKANAASEAVE